MHRNCTYIKVRGQLRVLYTKLYHISKYTYRNMHAVNNKPTSTILGFAAVCNEHGLSCYAPACFVLSCQPQHVPPIVPAQGHGVIIRVRASLRPACLKLLSSEQLSSQPLFIICKYLGTRRALRTSKRDSRYLVAFESALAARLLHLNVSPHI